MPERVSTLSLVLTRHRAAPLFTTLASLLFFIVHPSTSRAPIHVRSSPAMASTRVGAAASRRMSLLVLLLVAVFAGSSLAQAPGNRTEAAAAAAARTCTYTVKVKTSCASPARTSDAVSVAFGDAYRNEAYGARLPGGGRAFERCGADTFHVSGACGYGVCYLYLRRAGRDGWAPEWVQVAEPGPGAGEKPATFRFGDPLPDGVWHGHNRCPKAARTAAAARTNTSSATAASSPRG